MNPLAPTFLFTLIAFILLVLVTFSTPFVPAFYFLQANFTGDNVRFGIWGWCSHAAGVCTTKALGYHWDPEIIVWMTKVLIFYPIAAIFTLLALIGLIPALYMHRRRDTIFPPPLYSLLIIPAALTSLIAFAFTIALFTVARERFRDNGFDASYGPLPWLSLVAMIILLLLMFYTECGATWRGPFGQMSPHIRNRWSAVYAY